MATNIDQNVLAFLQNSLLEMIAWGREGKIPHGLKPGAQRAIYWEMMKIRAITYAGHNGYTYVVFDEAKIGRDFISSVLNEYREYVVANMDR